jgi:hypothetical protein
MAKERKRKTEKLGNCVDLSYLRKSKTSIINNGFYHPNDIAKHLKFF